MTKISRPSWLKRVLVIVMPLFLLAVISFSYYFNRFVANANFQEVLPQKVYKSGQPTSAQLQQWVYQYGIRTVINLRGNKPEITGTERSVTNQLGVKLVTFSLSAYRLPSRAMLAKIIYTLENAELPILIHCRNGIDRAGTVGAIAEMALSHTDYRKASCRAYVPPGPWKQRDGGQHISDLFVLYEKYCWDNNLDTGGWQEFKRWATDIYQSSDHIAQPRPPSESCSVTGDKAHTEIYIYITD